MLYIPSAQKQVSFYKSSAKLACMATFLLSTNPLCTLENLSHT